MTTEDTADVTDVDETDEASPTNRRRGHGETTTRPPKRKRSPRPRTASCGGRTGAVRGPNRRHPVGGCPASPRQASRRGCTSSSTAPTSKPTPAAAAVALDAAKNGTVALLSYSPESLDKDFAAAKSHLTGDFLSYYTQFTQQIVTPAAKQKSVKTSAAVVRAGGVRTASGLRGGAGVHQPDHHQQGESRRLVRRERVKVGLKKINDAWLISSFDPV